MTVDVLTEVEIARARDVVATYATDPAHAPAWYVNIREARWLGEPRLAVGARVAFTAHFLGRKLEYTYEIVEHVPGEKLVMRTAEGPFPMETTYTFEEIDEGRTRMRLRNRGRPAGFAKLAAPLLAGAMRRANVKDLARLKEILESSPR